MHVHTIPCLKDNFAYLLVCPETRQAAVVDPGEYKPVLAMVEQLGVTLTTIFNTHHHHDHVGGNKGLLKRFPQLKVWAHARDSGMIPGQTEFLEEGDPVSFGQLKGSFTHNPGHTNGAVSYYFEDCAFTGDTLFAAGCGRLFEGTPADMYRSLYQKIGAFPPQTKIYFGHEYTENNLRFALSVEPDNEHVQKKLQETRELRARGQFTTPSTLASEWATNPFMRCDRPGIQATVKQNEPGNDLSPISVLRVIRGMKDQF